MASLKDKLNEGQEVVAKAKKRRRTPTEANTNFSKYTKAYESACVRFISGSTNTSIRSLD
jgi:hypothetical protein